MTTMMAFRKIIDDLGKSTNECAFDEIKDELLIRVSVSVCLISINVRSEIHIRKFSLIQSIITCFFFGLGVCVRIRRGGKKSYLKCK